MFSRKDYQKAAEIVRVIRDSHMMTLVDKAVQRFTDKEIKACHYEEAFIQLFSGTPNFNVAEFKAACQEE